MTYEYTRRVSPGLTVRFDHCDYDVRSVPGVKPGDMLLVGTIFHGKRGAVYVNKYDKASDCWHKHIVHTAKRRAQP